MVVNTSVMTIDKAEATETPYVASEIRCLFFYKRNAEHTAHRTGPAIRQQVARFTQ